jgi:hypothetical protein
MHAAEIYAEMLGLVCHRELYTSHPNGYQEVPYFVDSVDSRHLLFMRDMLLFTFSTPNFQILISATSHVMALNTNRESPIQLKSQSVNLNPIECVILINKRNSSDFYPEFYIRWSVDIAMLDISLKTSGILITMAFLGYLPDRSGLMVDEDV